MENLCIDYNFAEELAECDGFDPRMWGGGYIRKIMTLMKKAKLSAVATSRVSHARHAFSICFITKANKFSCLYSGDCLAEAEDKRRLVKGTELLYNLFALNNHKINNSAHNSNFPAKRLLTYLDILRIDVEKAAEARKTKKERSLAAAWEFQDYSQSSSNSRLDPVLSLQSPNEQKQPKLDLLIHEATFEHALADNAKQNRHSTAVQAMRVGKKLGAKFTMLTHFSQRYQRLPVYDDILIHDALENGTNLSGSDVSHDVEVFDHYKRMQCSLSPELVEECGYAGTWDAIATTEDRAAIEQHVQRIVSLLLKHRVAFAADFITVDPTTFEEACYLAGPLHMMNLDGYVKVAFKASKMINKRENPHPLLGQLGL